MQYKQQQAVDAKQIAFSLALVGYTGDHLLRLREVLKIVGFSRAYLYSLIADGRFPAPARIDHACSRWSASAVAEWVECVKKTQGVGPVRGAARKGAK